MKFISRPMGGLVNLPKALFAVLLCFTLASSGDPLDGGGDGGLVNLPGGGSAQAVSYLEDLGIVFHEVDGALVVDNGYTYEVSGGEAPVVPTGQSMKTTWVDNDGLEHTVETKYSGTDYETAVRRHNKLLIVMKGYYPPRQGG